jgi:alanyl aminopeptidase
VAPTARRLGWAPKSGESEDDKLLRASALEILGRLGEDPATLTEAERVADAWLTKPESVDAEIARMAVQVAAKRGSAKLFERLVTVAKATPLPDVRSIVLYGLASFEQPDLARRALDLTVDGTIKQQDLGRFLHTIGTERATRDVVVAWLEARLDDLAKVAPRFIMSDLPRVAATLCDPGRVREVAGFLAPRLRAFEGVEQNLRKSVEEGLRCAALVAKERASTEKWLGGGQRAL